MPMRKSVCFTDDLKWKVLLRTCEQASETTKEQKPKKKAEGYFPYFQSGWNGT